MAREIKYTYESELTLNDQVIQSPPLLGQTSSNFGGIPMGAKSKSIAALDTAIEYEIQMGTLDPNMDKKHMRRVISNRYAAKKSYERKANKMVELEQHLKVLEDTIATLQPQLEKENQLRLNLTFENKMLAQQLQLQIDLNSLKYAQTMELEKELQRLRELLNMQLQRTGS